MRSHTNFGSLWCIYPLFLAGAADGAWNGQVSDSQVYKYDSLKFVPEGKEGTRSWPSQLEDQGSFGGSLSHGEVKYVFIFAVYVYIGVSLYLCLSDQ